MVWLTAWLQRAWHSEVFPHLFAYCGQSCILPFLAGLFCGISLGGLLYLHILDFCSFVFSLRSLVLFLDLEEILKGVYILDLFFCDCGSDTLSSSKVDSFSLSISWPSFWSSSTRMGPSKQQVAEPFHHGMALLVDGGATVARFMGLSWEPRRRETICSSKTDWTAHARLLAMNCVWLQGEGWHKSSCYSGRTLHILAQFISSTSTTRHTPTKASHMVRASMHCILSSFARVSWLSKNEQEGGTDQLLPDINDSESNEENGDSPKNKHGYQRVYLNVILIDLVRSKMAARWRDLRHPQQDLEWPALWTSRSILAVTINGLNFTTRGSARPLASSLMMRFKLTEVKRRMPWPNRPGRKLIDQLISWLLQARRFW